MRVPSIIHGSLIGLTASTIVLSAAMLGGFTAKVSQWVLAVGFVATFLATWLWPRNGNRPQIFVGTFVVLAVGLLSAIVTGFGALEWSMVVGASLAAAVVWFRPSLTPVVPRGHLWVFMALAVAAFVITPLTLSGGTLGHDESAYALKARSWIDDTPATGWSLHRGIGMSLYAVPLLRSGGGEASLRALGLVATLVLIVAVWLLGRSVGNARVGGIAALAIVAGPAILRRGTEYLSDIPSAALLVLVMLIVWLEFDERAEGPTYRLLYAVPLALVAFYIRYQSILSLGLIALTAIVLSWSKIRARPGPIFAVVAAGLIGLIPHALFAADQTGSPLGILLRTGGGAVRDYLGQGLVDYGWQLGWLLAGFAGPVALVFLVFAGVHAVRHSRYRRPFLFLGIPAILQIIALGIVSHGEPRFIFFPLALALVIMAWTINDLAASATHHLMRPVGVTLAIVLVGSLGLSSAWTRDSVAHRAHTNQPIEAASAAISSQDCGALTSYLPQVTFYSGCFTSGFNPGQPANEQVAGLDGSNNYMILVEGGKRQPSGEDLESLIDATIGSPIELPGATIYAFPRG